jgi:hypothetical protein
MRRELLHVAAGLALVYLIGAAAIPTWRGVEVRTSTAVANVTNITFVGAVTAAQFVGGGGGLTGVAGPETNWWAVFRIPNHDGMNLYYDFTLKASTNVTADYDGGCVFVLTSADADLDGTPAGERFSTNWYPRIFFTHAQDWETYDPRTVQAWKNDSTASSLDNYLSVGFDPHNLHYLPEWVVMVRDTGAWFHPSNNIAWTYLRQADATNEYSGRDRLNGSPIDVWRQIVPEWTSFDPRPRRFRSANESDYEDIVISAPHQKP